MIDDKIICPRCSAEMKSNSRYCMKCGYLNYNHPENANLKPHMGKLQETTNFVNGNAQIRNFVGASKNHEIVLGSNTGSKKLCFLVNGILYLICLIFTFLFYLNQCDSYVDILQTNLPFIYIIITLFFMFWYSYELIYMKMNEKWWVAFIPFYNVFVMSYKVMGSYLFGILSLVPGVSIIYSFVLMYKLGVKFGYNGFLFMLLCPVLIPVCGFSDNCFDGVTYVAGLENNDLEKEYKLKNCFIIFSSAIIIACLGTLGYINRKVLLDPVNSLKKYYYVYAAKAIYNHLNIDIKYKTINCDNGIYASFNDGEYYFYYDNVNYEFDLWFGSSKDVIEAYVKVINENNSAKYYISLTDGTYGIEEMEVSKVRIDDVKNMKKLSEVYVDGNNCKIKSK